MPLTEGVVIWNKKLYTANSSWETYPIFEGHHFQVASNILFIQGKKPLSRGPTGNANNRNSRYVTLTSLVINRVDRCVTLNSRILTPILLRGRESPFVWNNNKSTGRPFYEIKKDPKGKKNYCKLNYWAQRAASKTDYGIPAGSDLRFKNSYYIRVDPLKWNSTYDNEKNAVKKNFEHLKDVIKAVWDGETELPPQPPTWNVTGEPP